MVSGQRGSRVVRVQDFRVEGFTVSGLWFWGLG